MIETMMKRPTLLPAAVPWAISTSMPCLRLCEDDAAHRLFLTFVGYFKLNDPTQGHGGTSVAVVAEPEAFKLDPSASQASYRLIRITFDGAFKYRRCFSASDHEVLPEAEYDWSEVPGALRPGEDAMANLVRTDIYWLETGNSPDPGFYEVRNSSWIEECGAVDWEFRHYIAVGQDEYFEVIARTWHWEAGQRA